MTARERKLVLEQLTPPPFDAPDADAFAALFGAPGRHAARVCVGLLRQRKLDRELWRAYDRWTRIYVAARRRARARVRARARPTDRRRHRDKRKAKAAKAARRTNR